MKPRYAIYYTPPIGSALEALGHEWLGRTGSDYVQERKEAPEGFHESEYRKLVTAPRWYGLHGTLKAPFELAEPVTEQELVAEVRKVCSKHCPFTLPKLAVNYLGSFLALTLTAPSPELFKLSVDCVRELDALRAPLSEFDQNRHLKKKLSERQKRLLNRFGYPFVLEEFRFHMTLTDSMNDKLRPDCKRRLEEITAPYLYDEVEVTEVTICMQPNRETPFVNSKRIQLTGTKQDT